MTRYDIALGKKMPFKKTNKPRFSLDDGYRKSGMYKITKEDLGFFIIENTIDKLYVVDSDRGLWGHNKKRAKKFSSKKDAYRFWQEGH